MAHVVRHELVMVGGGDSRECDRGGSIGGTTDCRYHLSQCSGRDFHPDSPLRFINVVLDVCAPDPATRLRFSTSKTDGLLS